MEEANNATDEKKKITASLLPCHGRGGKKGGREGQRDGRAGGSRKKQNWVKRFNVLLKI